MIIKKKKHKASWEAHDLELENIYNEEMKLEAKVDLYNSSLIYTSNYQSNNEKSMKVHWKAAKKKK